VKVLLDECVDRRLADLIVGYDVKTVPEVGWASLKNGELLGRAEHKFDIFVTVDRSLSFQQTLSRYAIAVIVLGARSNPSTRTDPLAPRDLRKALVSPSLGSHCDGF